MRTLQLATSTGKGKVVDIEYSSMSNIIMVICHDYAFPITDIDCSTSYFLDPKHYKKLASYKSVAALVKYAKANQITDSASDAPTGSDSASVTPCPVPAPAPAKSAAKGQGTFSYVDTLKSIKAQINELNKHTFENSMLTDDEHYGLLSIEMQIDELIAYEPPSEDKNIYKCPHCPDSFNEAVREGDGLYSPCCGQCLDIYLPESSLEVTP